MGSSPGSASSGALHPLDLLPPELILQIISHLTLSDISAFARASQSCHALIKDSEQAIYRSAAFRLGLADPQTAGSTAAVVGPAPRDGHRQRDELDGVLNRQQSISSCYDGVQTWNQFGQLGSGGCASDAVLRPGGRVADGRTAGLTLQYEGRRGSRSRGRRGKQRTG